MNQNKTDSTKKKFNLSKEALSFWIISWVGVIIITILFPKFFIRQFDMFDRVTASVSELKIEDGQKQMVLTYHYKDKDYSGVTKAVSGSFVGKEIDIFVDPELPTSIQLVYDMSHLFGNMRLLAFINIVVVSIMALQSKFRKK